MKLIEILKLIDEEITPFLYDEYGIDSRPNSIFKVTICFMCEEETWITCNVKNEILIPWYDCHVSGIRASNEDTIEIWLKDEKYIKEKFPEYIKEKAEYFKEKERKNDE